MILILCITFFLSISLSQDINVSVDKNRLEESESIQFMIEVTGSDNFPKVDVKGLKNNFDIIGGPYEQTSIEYINGKMKNTKTLKWILSPKRSGNLIIPELRGSIDGKLFKSEPIKILVDKRSNEFFRNEIFIIADVDKKNVFLGEQITLTYKLYKHIDTKISGVDQFQMPDFNGFWVEELFTPQRLQYQNKEVLYQGRKYQVANLGQRALFPIASDNHIIPSVKIKTQIEKKKKKRRRDPFFDPFFNSFFAETDTKYIQSDEVKVIIKPFPEPKPSNFIGAVGDFKISVEIDQVKVNVNEGITLTVSMQGTGNLGLFTLPNVSVPKGMEAFPPNIQNSKDIFRNQITGSQKLEYVIIPRKTGNFKIPSLKMSYYNLSLDSWSEIKTKSIEINVTGEESQFISRSGLTKKEIELIGEDIRYIKTKSVSSTISPFRISTTAQFLYALSILIFSFPFYTLLFSKSDPFQVKERRKKNAIKTSLSILKNKKSDSFSIASEAIYVFVQEKFLLPSNNIDQTYVRNLLKNRADDATIEELINILKICDAGKYSPDQKEDGEVLLTKTRIILQKVNKVLK